jgi:MFS family permease
MDKIINKNFWTLLIILSCIAVVIEYAETMLFPAIPEIIKDFKIDYSTSSWILSGYLITAAVMAPIAGKLSDVYGKKKILTIIMSIFTISIISAGFSTNASFLIVSRFVQGMGLSMFIISLSILQSEVPKEKYALANGILASLYFSGSSIGLIVGGSIIHFTNWNVTFFSLIPVLLILYLIMIKFLKVKDNKQDFENNNNNNNNLSSSFSSSKRKYFDIKGVLALALSITFILVDLSYLQIFESSGSKFTLSSVAMFSTFFCISIVSVIAFIMYEKKALYPLIDLKFISNGKIFPILIIFFIMGFTMFMVYQTIPILVKEQKPIGFGGNTLTSSTVLLPFTIIFLVISPLVSKIIKKFGNTKPFIAASVVSFIGFLAIFVFHENEFQIGINLAIISIGLSLINTIAMNIILLLTPKHFGGVVVGIVQVFTFTGMAIGPVISALYMQIYQIRIINNLQVQSVPSIEAYAMIFLTAAIASFTFVIMTFIVKRSIPIDETTTKS